MNNKGFAITGIIYTLFILFLMILLSVLSGLSSYKNMMSNSIAAFEDSFLGTKVDATKLAEINADDNAIAPFTGKYLYDIVVTNEAAGTTTNYTCSTYLAKGTNFKTTTIVWSPKDCNDYIKNEDIKFKEVYSFEE